MPLFSNLNNLDLLLIVFLFLGIVIGFLRGPVPQIISLVSIWLGLVVTLWLYKPFSVYILQGLIPNTSVGSDTISFLILLIVFFNVFRLVVKSLSAPPEEKKKKKKKRKEVAFDEGPNESLKSRFVAGPFQAIGGMIMGFILMTIWLSLILAAIQFIFQDALTRYTGGAGLIGELRTSTLVNHYSNQVLWTIVQSVQLFVPRNADILTRVLELITRTG